MGWSLSDWVGACNRVGTEGRSDEDLGNWERVRCSRDISEMIYLLHICFFFFAASEPLLVGLILHDLAHTPWRLVGTTAPAGGRTQSNMRAVDAWRRIAARLGPPNRSHAHPFPQDTDRPMDADPDH